MKCQALYFTRPGEVEVREEPVAELACGQLLVRTLFSAISPGTEMLVYHQKISPDMPLDTTISSLRNTLQYPLKYGYSAVGKVVAVASAVDAAWLDKTVLAFSPHVSLFTASPDELLPLPEYITPEEALFLPNMETALNFVMDGRPMVGEDVLVLGQGIVGLLTTALLSGFPLASLTTLDRYPFRRETSQKLGAGKTFDPRNMGQVKTLLKEGADLTFELSGNPQALNQAIDLTGFAGRIILGSWYGQKKASLELGGDFHRSRIRLISSQVSTLSPDLSGRWNKLRRFSLAWQMLAKVKPADLISRRIPIAQAAEAYRMLDQNPGEIIQVIFTY